MRWAAAAQDIAQLLMEVAWITVAGALAAVLIGAQSNPVPLWIGVSVAATGFALRRFFVPETAPVVSARALLLGAGAAALYIGIAILPGVGFDFTWPLHLMQDWLDARHVVAGGILITALWLRATALGQEDASEFSVAQSFRIGVGVVVLGAIAHILLPVPVGATAATFLFFGAGMAAFALTHIISMGPEESAGLSDWPKMAAITVGGIALGSVALAIIAEGDVGRAIASGFRLAAMVLTPVVVVLAWALGMVVEALTYVLLYATSFFRESSEPITFTPTTPNFSNVDRTEGGSGPVPFWVLRFLSWSAVLMVIVTVAYLLWRSFAQRARTRSGQEGEERERLESDGDLGEDLAEALASLVGRFARRRRRGPSPRGFDPNDPRAVALGAYQALLALAANGGIRRLPWQTPDEFQASLSVRYPASDVSTLTQAFTRARYGFLAPTGSEAALIREAWERLRFSDETETDGDGPATETG